MMISQPHHFAFYKMYARSHLNLVTSLWADGAAATSLSHIRGKASGFLKERIGKGPCRTGIPSPASAWSLPPSPSAVWQGQQVSAFCGWSC